MKFLLQPLDGDLAADAFAAVKDDRLIGDYSICKPGDVAQGDQLAPDIERSMFVGFPHIDQLNIFPAVEFLFQCGCCDGLHTVRFWSMDQSSSSL